MDYKKIGFIGCGNMAKAMMGGMLSTGIVNCADVTASDVYKEGLQQAQKALGIHVTQDNLKLVEENDIIFLAVKPNVLYQVIAEIAPVVTSEKLIVSIAAGQSISTIEQAFGKPLRLFRVMPNTPALVGAGMTGASPNEHVTEEDKDMVQTLLNSFGRAEIVPEKLMDAVVAVSGSSPAYVFMFIEAMADAAVIEGMPRALAYTFAEQAVMGSAKLALETGKHPGELKDMVCSPAGTTISAVSVLEKSGFRSAVMEAMESCAQKSKELGKN